jgi:hypothetical protein
MQKSHLNTVQDLILDDFEIDKATTKTNSRANSTRHVEVVTESRTPANL